MIPHHPALLLLPCISMHAEAAPNKTPVRHSPSRSMAERQQCSRGGRKQKCLASSVAPLTRPTAEGAQYDSGLGQDVGPKPTSFEHAHEKQSASQVCIERLASGSWQGYADKM